MIMFKIFSDLCLCYLVIETFPEFFTHDMALYVQGLVCVLAVGIGDLSKRKDLPWVRYLMVALCVATMFLGNTTMEHLILLPGVIYCALVLVKGSFALEYYSFLEHFQKMLRILAIYIWVVFVCGYFEGMFGSMFTAFDLTSAVIYGMLFAVPGIFLLRQLRMGPDSRAQDRRMNIIQMVTVSLLILVLTVSLIHAESMIHHLFELLAYGIMILAGIIPMIIHSIWMLVLNQEKGGMEEFATAVTTEFHSGDPIYPSGTGEMPPPPAEPAFPWWAAVLILAALCALLIYFLRTLRPHEAGFASDETLEEIDSIFPRPQKVRSHRAKVRKYYRNYLKYAVRKGQKLGRDQTSKDIWEAAPYGVDKDASQVLRQIYLKARYSDHEITRRDAEEAKKALQRSQKSN